MNDNKPSIAFEQNLASLLRVSLNQPESVMENRLIQTVLAEVRLQQPKPRRFVWHTHTFRWATVLVAAALLIVVVVYGFLPSKPVFQPTGSAGEVRTLYGMVELKTQDDMTSSVEGIQTIQDQWVSIPVNAWVQTCWGSQAEVRLADESRVLSRPKTMLTVERGRSGERIILDEGWISVEAAKQQPGKSLQIQTPGTCISVLGTKFDVHVVQKANGHKQTRVSVASGKVAMESGGQQIFLTPNTEGIAEEGQVPSSRCLTPEINEILRLNNLGKVLARDQQATPGTPSLVEFHVDGTATVWLIVQLKKAKSDKIALKVPVTEVAVYSMTGEPINANLDEQGMHISLVENQAIEIPDERLILRLSGIKELFSPKGKGVFEFIRADEDAAMLSLYQIWLPESATIEEIQPKPIETAQSLSRQTITLAVHAQPPDLIE